ncbi:hypothetical protein [Erwinia typographi]|uniref:hypothetical protein n=1 Tax=Erwinia typographi TaxID=371042 RepID=UPI0012EEB5E8|nr:hypothetical protein [Erwinia typographi]
MVTMTLLFGMTLAANAYAKWMTEFEDDIFNDAKKVVMVGEVEKAGFLAFECENNILTASYIEAADVSQIQEGIFSDMYIKIDNSPRVRLSGVSVIRNQKSFAMQGDGPTDSIKILIKELHNAKERFLFGFKTEQGGKFSSSGDVDGSTGAVEKFVKACSVDIPLSTVAVN